MTEVNGNVTLTAKEEIHGEPARTADDPRVVRVLEEYLSELQAGRAPDPKKFVARYPELAQVLEECLGGLKFIRSAAAQVRDPEQAVPPAMDESAAAEIQGEAPLGDYRLVREIGRGGMGVVYEAVQISLGRRIALKVLPFAAAVDSKRLMRFKNEAQAAAHLHHQHIVPVHAVGCERGVHYYAMQFIEGEPLSNLIRAMREQRDGKKVDELPATAAYESGADGAEQPEDQLEKALARFQ